MLNLGKTKKEIAAPKVEEKAEVEKVIEVVQRQNVNEALKPGV